MNPEVVIHSSITDFSKEQWNHHNGQENPFISWEFFKALEVGGCLDSKSAWRPFYFGIVRDGHLSAALPLYLKTDSYGEFIFDWSWAQAYARYGIPYYPKLTSAIPYSPVSAPKLLGDLKDHQDFLLPQLKKFYQEHPFSGLHFLFTSKREAPLLKDIDLMERDSIQYHWQRNSCLSFEDYLAPLKKNRRKSIRKERRKINESQIEIALLEGADIQKEDIDFFYRCYRNTIEKKWSQAYLSSEFFHSFIEQAPHFVSLFQAKEKGQLIASALYFHSSTTLYGRYWGSLKEVPFLHFELCLYRGIELCLQKGLATFEAGAQGEHKRMRGFPPIITKSFHHLKHPEFSKAVKNFIEEERQALSSVFTP